MDRSLLEYHLTTLTNRSQENDFEQFARQLLEREVCPNLLPHSGPTGGGDSKVDSETFPVADDLASTWYVGIGRKASEERWAFAFSAKKDWRSKCQSDVKKVAQTSRGYAKAFFVTSQFVPDKARAEVEAALMKEHGLDVRILDRNWILERVYAGKHQQLAIDALRLQLSTRMQTVKGPFDSRREKKLADVEARIDQAAKDGIGIIAVQHMLEAALLARSLERPRSEIDGRFGRAREAAEKYGSQHQRVTIAYQEAFTAFWWFEDYPVFLERLNAFEQLAAGTANVYHLELATTLWMGLFTAVRAGQLDAQQVGLQERTNQLTTSLDAMATREEQPSAVLEAEALSLQVRLLTSPDDAVNDLLERLKTVIERSVGLLGFPLSAVVEMISESGAVFGDNPTFDELYAAAIQAVSTRDGEIAAATLLVKRGMQQLDADKNYQAIRMIGQALARLHNEESMPDLVRALYVLGSAYERAGLLWAARGSLLYASSISTHVAVQGEVVTLIQAACYDHLRWIELRLGRVPHAMAWHEVTSLTKAALAQRGVDLERLRRGDLEFDAVMGMLLLRADLWDLKRYARIVDTLEDMGLHWASTSLKFALGHEDIVAKELTTEGEKPPNLNDFFSLLAHQPAARDLAVAPAAYSGRTETIVSYVLGCEIRVEMSTASPCQELGESIIAATESFLATGMVGHKPIVSRVPLVTIVVRSHDLVAFPFQFESKLKGGNPLVEVRAGTWSPHSITISNQQELKDKLAELIAYVFANAFHIEDHENTLLQLIRDERALERALNFTGSFVAIANVLGDNPKHSLRDWQTPGDGAYATIRSEQWIPNPLPSDAAQASATGRATEEQAGAAASGASAPRPNWEEAKHSDFRNISLISIPLWDRAKWVATVFLTTKNDVAPPGIAPVFRDRDAAAEIFMEWRRELGADDGQDRIRVSVVRGISAANPHAYRIVIGADMAATVFEKNSAKFVMTVFRVCQMDPKSSVNLDRFLVSYAKHGSYDLLPAYTPPGTVNPHPSDERFWIRKRKLRVVNAWEIAEGDFDSVAITPDTKPMIPKERQSDAPVLSLLEKRRAKEGKSGS